MADSRDKLNAAIANAKKSGPAPKAKSESASPAPSSLTSAPSKSKAKKSKAKKKQAKKKQAKKKKSGGGNLLGDAFGKIAKHFVEELKDATSKISPGKLIESAKDGISQINLPGKDSDDQGITNSPTPAADPQPAASAPTFTESASLEGGSIGTSAGAPDQAGEDLAADEGTSVSAGDLAAPVEGAEDVPAPEEIASEEPRGAEETTQKDSALGASPASADDAPPVISPAKVQRPAKKRSPRPEKDEEPENAPEETPTLGDDSPAATDVGENTEVEAEAEPDSATTEPEEPTEEATEPESAAEPEQAVAEPPEARDEGDTKKAKRESQQNVQVSAEEQHVRGFHALHTLLTNEIWAPIAVDAEAKPSSIFAPRQRFDTQWSSPEFKEGLKAASLLASTYTFNPGNIKFDQKIIDAIKGYEFPYTLIKPRTELITKAIGETTTKAVLEMMKRGDVSNLLHSLGTRLGTFVPTIEMLVRIYLGLRKKDEIIPGERLKIQEEVVMKYAKGPYTEDMGKKARNLSLNYFTDYLLEYGLNVYSERVAKAPEGQNNLAAQKRRHDTIKKSCSNLMRDWGTKVGIARPAMMNLEARFHEQTDRQLADLVGEVPEPEAAE